MNYLNFGISSALGIKPNEKSCYDEIVDSVKLNDQNRYEANLPFKENHPLIPDNYILCEKRLLKLYSKLKENPELFRKYNDIFTDTKKVRYH